MVNQFAFLKKKNLKHSQYAKQSTNTLFGKKVVKNANEQQVNYPYSIVTYGNGSKTFTIKKLPVEAQLSCINDICILPKKQKTLLQFMQAATTLIIYHKWVS